LLFYLSRTQRQEKLLSEEKFAPKQKQILLFTDTGSYLLFVPTKIIRSKGRFKTHTDIIDPMLIGDNTYLENCSL